MSWFNTRVFNKKMDKLLYPVCHNCTQSITDYRSYIYPPPTHSKGVTYILCRKCSISLDSMRIVQRKTMLMYEFLEKFFKYDKPPAIVPFIEGITPPPYQLPFANFFKSSQEQDKFYEYFKAIEHLPPDEKRKAQERIYYDYGLYKVDNWAYHARVVNEYIKKPVERKTMNPVEQVAEKVVISVLTDIQKNHLAIMKFITLGKVTDPKIEEINNDILWALDFLKPIINDIHNFVPESTPVLADILDWAKDMINALDPDKK